MVTAKEAWERSTGREPRKVKKKKSSNPVVDFFRKRIRD
jgi:hypothetical protein